MYPFMGLRKLNYFFIDGLPMRVVCSYTFIFFFSVFEQLTRIYYLLSFSFWDQISFGGVNYIASLVNLINPCILPFTLTIAVATSLRTTSDSRKQPVIHQLCVDL